jgi:hypothetical protein
VFILNLLVVFSTISIYRTMSEGQGNMIFDVVSTGLFMCGVSWTLSPRQPDLVPVTLIK